MSNVTLGFQSTPFKQVGMVEIPDIFYNRFKTGIEVFDDMLGGQGLLPGCTFTITGKPGAGKTTFLLQMLESLQKSGKMAGYVSSEENIAQLAYTCKRLGISLVQVANKTDVDEIAKAAKDFDILIVDSFQFLTCKQTDKPLATQKHVIKTLIQAAQANECVIGIVQHLTVTGSAKGGTIVPHAVDINMRLIPGEPESGIVELEVYKNRFGRVGDALLKMSEHGFDFSFKLDDNEAPIESAKHKKAVKNGEIERQHIINFITEYTHATIEDLQTEDIPDWRIPHYLRVLVAEGILKKVGRGTDSYWKLAEGKED